MWEFCVLISVNRPRKVPFDNEYSYLYDENCINFFPMSYNVCINTQITYIQVKSLNIAFYGKRQTVYWSWDIPEILLYIQDINCHPSTHYMKTWSRDIIHLDLLIFNGMFGGCAVSRGENSSNIQFIIRGYWYNTIVNTFHWSFRTIQGRKKFPFFQELQKSIKITWIKICFRVDNQLYSYKFGNMYCIMD